MQAPGDEKKRCRELLSLHLPRPRLREQVLEYTVDFRFYALGAYCLSWLLVLSSILQSLSKGF